MTNLATTSFLRARDPITHARGSDVLHFLARVEISDDVKYTTWLGAFRRLTAIVADEAREAAAVEAKKSAGSVGGVYRAVGAR